MNLTRPLIALLLLLACSSCLSPNGTEPAPKDKEVATGPTQSASGRITVTSPLRGQKVSSPLEITGQALVFENRLSFRLRKGANEVLGEGTALAAAPDIGQPGPFTGALPFAPQPPGTTAFLEVFAVRPQDGAPDHVVTIPLELQ